MSGGLKTVDDEELVLGEYLGETVRATSEVGRTRSGLFLYGTQLWCADD
jgi:hypothetical protein